MWEVTFRALYIQGNHHSDALIRSDLQFKSICQKKEKQQYISVSTVRMFLEPSAKHQQSLG